MISAWWALHLVLNGDGNNSLREALCFKAKETCMGAL